MERPEICSNVKTEQLDQQLEMAITNFRKELFRKSPDDLKREGSCLRLKVTAREVASLLIGITGQSEMPINLEPICRKMLIHAIVDQDNSLFLSELIPDHSGFVVRVSREARGGRRSAAIAHEIGHTLFYDTTKFPPIRILNKACHSSIDKQEWISWDFARELLLPSKLIIQKLCQTRFPSVKKLCELAEEWRVSVDLLCHRIIHDLGIWGNCVLFTSNLEKNSTNKKSIRIYRGKEFPKFRLLGNKGLLTASDEFAKLVAKLQRMEVVEEILEFSRFRIWVELVRFSSFHTRLAGVLEIPGSVQMDSEA
jgi:Zn-dependent peptidase ImmA (M78 family)